jgi:TonB family protein
VGLVFAGYLVVHNLTPAPSPSPSFVPATTLPPPTTVPPVTTTTLPLPTGVLHVETEPPGASVKVNGDLRGVTPLDVGGLAFGAYEVRLELKGFETRSTNLTLSPDSANGQVKLALARVAPPTGIADILSTPFGASVTVDGRKVGQTPLTDFKVGPGSHTVQIARDGYEPWNGVLKVEAGKRQHTDVTLKAVALPSPSPTPAPVDPNHVYQNKPSEVDTPARQVSGSSPDYPQGKAPRLKSGESVSVAYELVVDNNGDVESVKVTESAGKAVDDVVVAALKKYKFSPALKQGIKVKVLVPGRQTFKMG